MSPHYLNVPIFRGVPGGSLNTLLIFWRRDPLQSGDYKQRPFLGNDRNIYARNNRTAGFSVCLRNDRG
jgi:hypothetical protein